MAEQCTFCGTTVNVPCRTREVSKPCANLRDSYIKQLRAHDWTFEWSDDHSVWTKGKAKQQAINNLQEQIDEDYSIWNQYAPSDFKVDAKRWEVKGYTKTGVYSDIVYASSELNAIYKGRIKIAKLKPPSPVLNYVAALD